MSGAFPSSEMDLTHILVVSDMSVSKDFYRDGYETLRSRGAAFLTPPHDWGQETRCFFRDPDGHLLELSAVGDTPA